MDEDTTSRFWSKVNKRGPVPSDHPELGACWVWTAQPGNGGYAQFSVRGKQRYAHRISWEITNGPIPAGKVIDHTCRLRSCVRPEHLRLATPRENVFHARAWEGGAAYQRQKSRCPKGHPYDSTNTYVRPDGSRGCRECGRVASRAFKIKRRAEQPSEPRVPKTHCKNGHEFTAENTYVSPSTGSRTCRECKRQQVRAYRSRSKSVQFRSDRCKAGHLFDEANTYVAPTGARSCRACSRSRSRAWYARSRSGGSAA